MKKLVLAYSGGLDTSYCLKSLSEEGYHVDAVSVNTGGFTQDEILDQKYNALKMGAKKFKSINALNSFKSASPYLACAMDLYSVYCYLCARFSIYLYSSSACGAFY